MIDVLAEPATELRLFLNVTATPGRTRFDPPDACTGSEGRISCLKRDFGWNRTRIDGLDGARTWCGHGVFNHNLVEIAALTTPTTT